jgi:hypothetical protein
MLHCIRQSIDANTNWFKPLDFCALDFVDAPYNNVRVGDLIRVINRTNKRLSATFRVNAASMPHSSPIGATITRVNRDGTSRD